MISNVGPLGCIPSWLAVESIDDTCVANDNELVQGFNKALKNLTKSVAQSFPNAMFLYGNSYDIVYGIIQDPYPLGNRSISCTLYLCTIYEIIRLVIFGED